MTHNLQTGRHGGRFAQGRAPLQETQSVACAPHEFQDLREALPAHTVAKWLGHSPLVAAKHYLQTRDAHFELAIRGMPRVGEAEAQAAPVRATA